MQISQEITFKVKRFHLDNPDAPWELIKGAIREFGDDILGMVYEWDTRQGPAMALAEHSDNLRGYLALGGHTRVQVRGAKAAWTMATLGEERILTGDPVPLTDFIDSLDDPTDERANGIVREVLTPASGSFEPAMTFEQLSQIYLEDQGSNMKPSTLTNTTYQCRSLGEVCGELDLRTHTRADLVAVKARLVATRKGSTVNSLLARLSTVLSWGVNNGHLERAFDKKLKLAKGADSSREALTQEQVQRLMDAVSKWPETKWERWFITLGCITGARLGEIYYLLKEDVREVDGGWVIDINEGEGKSLKNEYSARLVPLIDGAYGFDLKAFLEFVGNMPKGARLSKTVYKRVSMDMNVVLKEILGDEKDSTTTFHSLRHSLASLLKATGTPLEAAQSILGHSSNSITYDHYGAGSSLQLGIVKDALRKALPIKGTEPS